MKRAMVASILGLVLTTSTTFGQASIQFNNYAANPVVWTSDTALAPSGEAGNLVPLSDNFKVDLLWQYGSIYGDAMLSVPVGTPYGPGYFDGGNVIPSPPLGPGLELTFTVLAWNGASFATSSATGSVSWTQVLGPTGNPLNMPTLTVQLVPEPSVIGLGILGGLALLKALKR